MMSLNSKVVSPNLKVISKNSTLIQKKKNSINSCCKIQKYDKMTQYRGIVNYNKGTCTCLK